MPLRKFADLVEIKLGLKVGRSTIQRIVKSKEELLAIPEHYRTTRHRGIPEVQTDFEKHLYRESLSDEQLRQFVDNFD